MTFFTDRRGKYNYNANNESGAHQIPFPVYGGRGGGEKKICDYSRVPGRPPDSRVPVTIIAVLPVNVFGGQRVPRRGKKVVLTEIDCTRAGRRWIEIIENNNDGRGGALAH